MSKCVPYSSVVSAYSTFRASVKFSAKFRAYDKFIRAEGGGVLFFVQSCENWCQKRRRTVQAHKICIAAFDLSADGLYMQIQVKSLRRNATI